LSPAPHESQKHHVLQAVFGSINSIANVENIKKALLHQMPGQQGIDEAAFNFVAFGCF
jgi:hypothetical protein